jgi:peptidoglycan hydrolase CwlO-like protein
MAEELNRDLKENLAAFVSSIDELDNAIALIPKDGNEETQGHIKHVSDNILSVRKHIAALDARIEKTTKEWDNLKKDEILLSDLETKIKKFLHQEHQS